MVSSYRSYVYLYLKTERLLSGLVLDCALAGRSASISQYDGLRWLGFSYIACLHHVRDRQGGCLRSSFMNSWCMYSFSYQSLVPLTGSAFYPGPP
jgi:hypothetical protein